MGGTAANPSASRWASNCPAAATGAQSSDRDANHASQPVISILIATFGSPEWERLARTRAYPSAVGQNAEVILHHEPGGTVASSRNAAASQASEPFLLYLDADDLLSPGYVTAMENAILGNLERHDLYTPALYRSPRRPAHFWPETDLQYGNWLTIGTVLHRDLFWKVGGFRNYPHGCEDWACWAHCELAGAKVVKVPGAVYVALRTGRPKYKRLRSSPAAYRVAYDAIRADLVAEAQARNYA